MSIVLRNIAMTAPREEIADLLEKMEKEIASLRGQLSLANHHARGRWGDYERALSERDEYRVAIGKAAEWLAFYDGPTGATPDAAKLMEKELRSFLLPNTMMSHGEDGSRPKL